MYIRSKDAAETVKQRNTRTALCAPWLSPAAAVFPVCTPVKCTALISCRVRQHRQSHRAGFWGGKQDDLGGGPQQSDRQGGLETSLPLRADRRWDRREVTECQQNGVCDESFPIPRPIPSDGFPISLLGPG